MRASTSLLERTTGGRKDYGDTDGWGRLQHARSGRGHHGDGKMKQGRPETGTPQPGSTGSAGGWNPVKNVSDPEIQAVAKWAVAEANREQHLTGDAAYHLVSVKSAQTQVVAGANYRLQIQVDGPSAGLVEAVVYDRPWDNTRTLTSFTPTAPKQGTGPGARTITISPKPTGPERGTQQPGGTETGGEETGAPQPVNDVSDSGIQAVAKWAVAEANQQQHLSGDAAYRLVSVKSAQTQVVAGEIYSLQIQVDHPTAELVVAVVYDRPWDNTRTLTSFAPTAQEQGTDPGTGAVTVAPNPVGKGPVPGHPVKGANDPEADQGARPIVLRLPIFKTS